MPKPRTSTRALRQAPLARHRSTRGRHDRGAAWPRASGRRQPLPALRRGRARPRRTGPAPRHDGSAARGSPRRRAPRGRVPRRGDGRRPASARRRLPRRGLVLRQPAPGHSAAERWRPGPRRRRRPVRTLPPRPEGPRSREPRAPAHRARVRPAGRGLRCPLRLEASPWPQRVSVWWGEQSGAEPSSWESRCARSSARRRAARPSRPRTERPPEPWPWRARAGCVAQPQPSRAMRSLAAAPCVTPAPSPSRSSNLGCPHASARSPAVSRCRRWWRRARRAAGRVRGQ